MTFAIADTSRALRIALAWAIACLPLVCAPPASGQLTIPTTGLLPPAPLERSIILGDHLAALQTQWLAPASAHQQSWINSINSRANQNTSGAAPASFAVAASDSSIAQSAGLRYAMTGDTADLNKAAAALLVAALPANNSNDFITHPELLTSYLSAYDFIRGAPLSALTAATRAAIESRLATLAQGLSYGNGTASNALGKIGATKALAGELLQNQPLLDTGLANLQTHYNYSTTDDGWFTDSQGHYLNYTLRHLALFVRAYQQGSGVDLYPNVQPLVDLSIALRKPDGTLPNVSNGLNSPVATHLFSHTSDAAAAARMLWNLESLSPSAANATNVQNNDGSSSSYFALTNFDVAAAPPAQSPTFLATGQSHVSVFRNDWSPSSDYLLMSPGVDSPFYSFPEYGLLLPSFHSHNDTAEILVASGGHYLLVAAGYNRTDLSNYPAGFQSQIPTNHNVILVDGDLGLLNEGRTMRPERFTHTDRLDSAERGDYHGVGDFATLEMEYGGAQVSRSSGFANEDYFVVADRMLSAATHDYGFNLIGRGAQTVLTNTPELIEIQWQHGGQQVIEHLVGTRPMSLATSSTYMHDQFNQYEVTQRMTATLSAANAGFLSVIETGPAGSPAKLAITDLSTTDFAALGAVNAAENYEDWILSQSGNVLRSVGPLTTDAEYTCLRHVGGTLDSAMFARGMRLTDAGVPLLESDQPLTMSLLFETSRVLGTVSDDLLVPGSQLRLFSKQIVSATLDGNPIAFFNDPSYGAVFLPSAGSLVINFFSVPEPSSLPLALAALASFALGRKLSRLGRRATRCRCRQSGR